MKIIFYSLLAIVLFVSCDKINGNNADECDNIKQVRIDATTDLDYGQTLKLLLPDLGINTYYSWTGPANFNWTGKKYEGTATLKNRGMYYLNISNVDCESKNDSVYIKVKLPQGVAPCTPTLNVATYNNLANDSYTTIVKGIESSYNQFALSCSGVGNLRVLFHQEWKTKEPEDGIYTTISSPSFGQIDYEYNKVFVTTTKSSIFWSSQPDQKVYVSHVNGKLQIKFCDLIMSGSNGTSYTTKISTNIVQTN